MSPSNTNVLPRCLTTEILCDRRSRIEPLTVRSVAYRNSKSERYGLRVLDAVRR